MKVRSVIILVLALMYSCGGQHESLKYRQPQQKVQAKEFSAQELLQVAISYNSQGKSEKAIGVLHRALKQDPSLAAAYREMGLALSRLNRLDEALVLLKKAVELDSSDVDAALLLGMIFDLEHHGAQALKVYEDALKTKPNHPELNHEYGLSLLMSGKPTEAVAALERARAFSNNAELLGDLGYAYLLSGQSKKASKVLKESVSRDGSKPEVLFNLARACVAAGDNKCAFDALGHLIKLVPNEPGPYFNLGLLLEKQGKTSKAKLAIEKALEIAPDFAPAKKWLKAHP